MEIKDLGRSLLRKRGTTVFLIIIASVVFVSILEPIFLRWSNIRSIMIGMSSDGLMTIAMTLVLVLGGIDLSVGSVAALSCVITGGLYLSGMDIWLAVLIALAVGVLVGLFDGIMIGKLGLPPFIVTLGMMSLARGGAYIFTQGSPLSLSGAPESFRFVGAGYIADVPVFFLIFIVLAAIFDFLMKHATVFRSIFYIGSNEKAAKLSGINVSKVKIWVYIVSALLATLAGILSLSRFNVATPSLGSGAETRAISAAVIGGATMTGGVGSVLGGVLGVILLNIVNSALIMLNVSVYWQDFVSGFILILAVTIDFLSHRKKS